MGSTKILYVEDEVFLGKIVKESLESRGYEVSMETDGANVLEAFKNHCPDVCVLDIMLPNKDGFIIAEEIRSVDMQVPIIFLTAKTQTQDLVKGFTLGANDYIRKPFSLEELIVRIDNAMRYRSDAKLPSSSSTIFCLGKFSYNISRQTLSLGKEEKKLSFRESELLKLLYEHRDKIIERREILNLLWGNDSFFNSRNLDVYITKLRSYFKEDDRVQIITIKGIGYRFVIA